MPYFDDMLERISQAADNRLEAAIQQADKRMEAERASFAHVVEARRVSVAHVVDQMAEQANLYHAMGRLDNHHQQQEMRKDMKMFTVTVLKGMKVLTAAVLGGMAFFAVVAMVLAYILRG